MKLKWKLWLFSLFFCSTLFSEGGRYLIITPDSYIEAARTLAQWKTRKGVKAKVIPLSQIGSSPSQIRNCIQQAYEEWDVKPEYVLLFGDASQIPLERENGTYTDCYYTDLEGNFHNEVIPGRLPAGSLSEAWAMVAKIFYYERWPQVDKLGWMKKAVLIVREDGDEDDTTYWNDIHFVAQLMTESGFVHIDTFSYYNGDDADDVKNAVNQGRGFVLYRGSGSCYWYEPFGFWPHTLQNGYKLPIVISGTCGQIDPNMSLCGELWVRAGTPNNLKGAVAFIGTTTSGYNIAHLRSAWTRAFFETLFTSDTVCKLGKLVEVGRQRVYELYGNVDEYRGLTCIGDPEMNVWTDVPREMAVQHPAYAILGFTTFDVSVSDDNGPLVGAKICIMQDTLIYEVDTTDSEGDAEFELAISSDDTIYVTVTCKNHIPYEGVVVVLSCIPGDCNEDGFVTQSDLVYLSNYLYLSGQEPPICADANGDCTVDQSDLIYLANYIFSNGDKPRIPCSSSY